MFLGSTAGASRLLMYVFTALVSSSIASHFNTADLSKVNCSTVAFTAVDISGVDYNVVVLGNTHLV